jgi:DNA modification methylase
MNSLPANCILHGDCVQLMATLPAESVDFVLTDPPYLVRYRSRDGRTVANDDRDDWLRPAFAEMFRLLKPRSLAVSFYGWTHVDLFFDAWKAAGFSVVGHLVFRKPYASSSRFLAYHHEQAFLLAKGDVTPPATPLPDVLDFEYTGNRLHPTQKPVECLTRIVRTFCKPVSLVLDPFCGSGSSLVAARDARCSYLGIELDKSHHRTATQRLQGSSIGQNADDAMPRARPFTRYAEAAGGCCGASCPSVCTLPAGRVRCVLRALPSFPLRVCPAPRGFARCP